MADKPKVTQAQVKELHDKCGLPVVRCKAALDAHGPDVDAALGALIDAREVKLAQLNPDLCSEALFARAQMAESTDAMRAMLRIGNGLLRDGKKGGAEAPKPPGPPASPADEDFSVTMARAMEMMNAPGMSEDLGRMAKYQAQQEKKRAERKKKGFPTHVQPPLPALTFEEFTWEGRDALPSWAGFQERLGAYTSQSSEKPSTGEVAVSVTPPGDNEAEPPIAPSAEQVAAYAFLKANEPAVAAAVVQAIFEHYPKLRENYGYDEADAERYMPKMGKPHDLRDLIGMGRVHVLAVVKDGMAYVGFELGCTWDEEHGLGVMTHGTRVISVGDGSDAFDQHAPEDDGGENLAQG